MVRMSTCCSLVHSSVEELHVYGIWSVPPHTLLTELLVLHLKEYHLVISRM